VPTHVVVVHDYSNRYHGRTRVHRRLISPVCETAATAPLAREGRLALRLQEGRRGGGRRGIISACGTSALDG